MILKYIIILLEFWLLQFYKNENLLNNGSSDRLIYKGVELAKFLSSLEKLLVLDVFGLKGSINI